MRNRSIQLGRLHFHHTLLDWIGRWPLGILAYRRRVLYVNEAAAHLLGGVRRRDLIGRPIGRIYRPDSYSPFGGLTRQRTLLRRLDGQVVPCDVLSFNVPMLQRGMTLLFLCPAADEAEDQPQPVLIGKYQNNNLTKSKISNSVFVVKNKATFKSSEASRSMVGTRVIGLNPPAPERAKKPVQQVYMHHCAMCGGDWVGIDADPGRCNYCYTPRWRTGKTRWQERREYDETVNDHPYDREAIFDLLRRSERGLTAFEVLRELELPHSRYDAVRRTLIRMMRDNQVTRVSRGRYAPPPENSRNGDSK